MRFFTLLLDPEDRGLSDETRRAYEAMPRRRGMQFGWQSFDRAAVLIAWNDPNGDPLVARNGGWIAAGTVRLDNREEVKLWLTAELGKETDLELVLRVVKRYGTAKIRDLLGDFAFVVWHGLTRSYTAVTDAFAVKKLYYAELTGHTAFASRAESLALDDRYDPQYFAELVAGCVPSPSITPYIGVMQLSPGTLSTGDPNRRATSTYWSPNEFETDPSWARKERDAALTCRHLLAGSVRQRLGARGTTWAQLSGGLDSSSIVSVAQWMATQGLISEGLAGTVTYVDRRGTDSDERLYSDAVVEKWGVRNEQIIDPPLWLEDGEDPPRTDRPRDALALYPRERRLLEIVRGAKGGVLLTGFAGDELFSGTMFFFADWLIRGIIGKTLREMVQRATRGRASVWELAFTNVLLPLLPGAARRRLISGNGGVVSWLTPDSVRRYQLGQRTISAEGYGGRLGRKYHHALVTDITAISRRLDAGFLGDHLDVRYPYLSRPLVEFALSLPPELCARPHARKWVLREAMRGILPELVRTRIGKGGVSALLGWSLVAQAPLLESLTRQPMLGALGVIDPTKLSAAFHAAPLRAHRADYLHMLVQSTLIFEAWLQLRSGRWPLRSALPQGVSS